MTDFAKPYIGIKRDKMDTIDWLVIGLMVLMWVGVMMPLSFIWFYG